MSYFGRRIRNTTPLGRRRLRWKDSYNACPRSVWEWVD